MPRRATASPPSLLVVLTLPAGQVAEEAVAGDSGHGDPESEEEDEPLIKRIKVEVDEDELEDNKVRRRRGCVGPRGRREAGPDRIRSLWRAGGGSPTGSRAVLEALLCSLGSAPFPAPALCPGKASEQSPPPPRPSQDNVAREILQLQLQEANHRAQEYRNQLLKKEQEAEQYRLQLEAMARQQANGAAAEGPSIEVSVEETVEAEPPTDIAVETVAS